MMASRGTAPSVHARRPSSSSSCSFTLMHLFIVALVALIAVVITKEVMTLYIFEHVDSERAHIYEKRMLEIQVQVQIANSTVHYADNSDNSDNAAVSSESEKNNSENKSENDSDENTEHNSSCAHAASIEWLNMDRYWNVTFVVHHHIPKTGGTSLEGRILQLYTRPQNKAIQHM